MKITGGRFKGKRLIVTRTDSLRPSMDMVKEAIFSILINRIHNLNNTVCLDLFCGSGGLGLEALSRGAKTVIFVDRASPCLKTLESNLKALRFLRDKETERDRQARGEKENARPKKDSIRIKIFRFKENQETVASGQNQRFVKAGLVNIDVFSAIKLFSEERTEFDIIFADPPYYKGKAGRHISQECLEILASFNILKTSGIIILEHYIKDALIVPKGLGLFQQKIYGDTSVSFYVLKNL